jgi:hypothetical protein
MSQIFVVTADRAELKARSRVCKRRVFGDRGDDLRRSARVRLASEVPDLVIADERLGAYNGLNVLLTARAGHPCADRIVTTVTENVGLEADAQPELHCMAKPRDASGWIAANRADAHPVARVA